MYNGMTTTIPLCNARTKRNTRCRQSGYDSRLYEVKFNYSDTNGFTSNVDASNALSAVVVYGKSHHRV
jgi:hypothetical protein